MTHAAVGDSGGPASQDPGAGFPAALLGVLLGAFVLAAIAALVTRRPGHIAPIWLGDAYAACWLLARRRRPWPEWPALLAAMAVGNVLAGATLGTPWSAALSYVPVNIAGVLVAALLLRRCCPPDQPVLPPRRLATALLMGGVLPAAAGALLAVLLLPPGVGGDLAELWLAWVIGGTAGALTVLPAGLHIVGNGGRLPRLDFDSVLMIAIVLVLSAVCLGSMSQPFVYLCMLLVTLAALRGYAATTLGVLGVSTLVSLMWATGVYVAPPVVTRWDAVFNHLPHAVALVPALMLAAKAQQTAEWRARFDALYSKAPEAIALTGAGGAVLAANPAAETLFGLTEAEIRRRGVPGLVDLADPRQHALLAEQSLKGVAHGMGRLRRGDGSLLEADISTARYRLPTGEWASHAFLRDATLRLRQEQALREGAELLQRLSDLVPGVLSVFEASKADSDGGLRVVWASSALEPMLGVSPDLAASRPDAVFDHVDPDDARRLRQRFAVSAGDGQAVDEEFAVQRPGQPRRWLSLHAMPLRLAGGTTQWHGYMADISERRAETEALREQRARLDLALASGGIVTWDNDIARGINRTSDQWNRILGYGPDELEQTVPAFEQQVHPDDLPRLRERRQNLRADEEAPVVLFRARHRDGSWRWMESRAKVVESAPDGRPLRLMGTTIDVTERIEADRLRAERDRAEAADRAKTAFMSRMSHELRTPLNAVLGFAQVLASDPDGRLDAVQREQLRQILSSSEHLLSQIDELLELAGVAPAKTGAAAAPAASTFAARPAPAPPPAPPLSFTPAPATPAAPTDGRLLRVLYAEDNPVNVTLLQLMARRRSDVVLSVARSGQEALVAVRENPPDLLLADMNLGDMTGLELAATLHGEAAFAGLRCVALSADALPNQIEAARRAGFADYLTKPVRMADLFRAFDEARAQIAPAPGA